LFEATQAQIQLHYYSSVHLSVNKAHTYSLQQRSIDHMELVFVARSIWPNSAYLPPDYCGSDLIA
jgi:hypothetical protein